MRSFQALASLLLLIGTVSAAPFVDDHVYLRDLNTGKRDVKVARNNPMLIPTKVNGTMVLEPANVEDPEHIAWIENEVAYHRNERRSQSLKKRDEGQLQCSSPFGEDDPVADICYQYCERGIEQTMGDKSTFIEVSESQACPEGQAGAGGRCAVSVSQSATVESSTTETTSHSVNWGVTITGGTNQLWNPFQLSVAVSVGGDVSWSTAKTTGHSEGQTETYTSYIAEGHTGRIIFVPFFDKHCGTMNAVHKLEMLEDGLQGCRNDLQIVLETGGVIPYGMLYKWPEGLAEDDRISWSEYCALVPQKDQDGGARGSYQLCDDANTNNGCDECYKCTL